MMAVSPTQGPDLPGLEFSLTMFEDPGVQLPESMMSWVALRALPDFIANLRLAAIRLRTEGGQARQGLRLPEQLRSRASSTLLDNTEQEAESTGPDQPTSTSLENPTMGPPGMLKPPPPPSCSPMTPAPELVTPPPSPSPPSKVVPPPYLSTPSGLELEAGVETPPATPKRQVLEQNSSQLSEDQSSSPNVMTPSNSSEDSFTTVLKDSEGNVRPAEPAAGVQQSEAMASPVSSPMRVAICSLGYSEAELELILYEERCIARETAVVERRWAGVVPGFLCPLDGEAIPNTKEHKAIQTN